MRELEGGREQILAHFNNIKLILTKSRAHSFSMGYCKTVKRTTEKDCTEQVQTIYVPRKQIFLSIQTLQKPFCALPFILISHGTKH